MPAQSRINNLVASYGFDLDSLIRSGFPKPEELLSILDALKQAAYELMASYLDSDPVIELRLYWDGVTSYVYHTGDIQYQPMFYSPSDYSMAAVDVHTECNCEVLLYELVDELLYFHLHSPSEFDEF